MSEKADYTYAKFVIKTEAKVLEELAEKIDPRFDEAVDAMLNCTGRIVITGMGKPFLIGQKIVATMASTGTPAMCLHPAEAIHGDLGMVVENDVVLAISNSGETEEISRLLPLLKKLGVTLIAMTGNASSTLAEYSDIILDMGKITEACPMGLAPTASTTAMLAIGDALALCLLKKRNFDKEQYAFYHPGGSLGRSLMKVHEIMRKGGSHAMVKPETTVKDVLLAITESRTGAASIVDDSGKLLGIFTDGDLRRHLDCDEIILGKPVSDIMTKNPRSIHENSIAQEAAKLMKEYKIDELPVVNDEGQSVGIIDIQDLLAINLL